MNTSTIFKKTTSIAIGGFDGMHLGHQKLFSLLDEEYGAIVVIETGHANMTQGMQRQYYTKHPIKIYDLASIKHLEAKEFVSKLLEDFPSLEHIVVGYDFHFGKDRAYDAKDLQRFFQAKVTVVDKVAMDGVAVHSHLIRVLIKEGDLKRVKHFLGRDYNIEGRVVSGQGLGKKKLVPTINVVTQQLLPKEGVYVTLTRLDDDVAFHPSVTFIGHRETTDGLLSLETHLIDRNVEIVASVEIVFLDYLRSNQKFKDLKELKNAINSDINRARRSLQSLAL